MPPALSRYKFERRSISPSNYAFTTKDCKAVEQIRLFIDSANPAELWDFHDTLLGTTDVESQVGRYNLVRTLPLAHGLYANCVVNAITSVIGQGQAVKVPYVPPPWVVINGGTPEQFPFIDIYPTYLLTVEFGPRVYTGIAPDAAVLTSDAAVAYDKADGTSDTEAIKITNEYERFTRFVPEAGDFLLSADAVPPGGALKFVADDLITSNMAVVSKVIRRMPDSKVDFTWFQVPYRYITSSHSWIQRLLGFINQTQFFIWPAGSLRYDGYKAVDYYPVQPTLDPFATYFTTSPKLCDITFTFGCTRREPAPTLTAGNPSRSNYLAKGWNLYPNFAVPGWHYLTPDGNKNKRPTYDSHMFERLFSDPDVDTGAVLPF